MTLLEFAVIVFGLFAGYWVVSKLFFPSPSARSVPKAGPTASAAAPAWNEVLQVSPDASPEAIRAAYQRMISQYHPDKVESLGQEIKDVAAAKSRDITVAYREAMKARGMEP
jgi:DnaJ domain